MNGLKEMLYIGVDWIYVTKDGGRCIEEKNRIARLFKMCLVVMNYNRCVYYTNLRSKIYFSYA